MTQDLTTNSLPCYLALRATTPFAQVDQTLQVEGWLREPDLVPLEVARAAPAPREPAEVEPTWAAWGEPGGTARAIYTINPLIDLRLLRFDGPRAGAAAASLAAHLPVLTEADLRSLLSSTNISDVLRGIYAAEKMSAVNVQDALLALMRHPSPVVAEAAKEVNNHLAATLLAEGAQNLLAAQARHPEHLVIWPYLGTPAERRQILRQLLAERPTGDEATVALLRTALQDADWEVRATAMLAAGRLRATNLGLAVRRVELPDTSRSGLDATDRRILAALRQTVLLLLQGAIPPPFSNRAPNSRETMQGHLLRCVAGLPEPWHDRVFLLVHALTEPLPPRPQRVEHLPAALKATTEGCQLAATGIALVWVPPMPHWLGDDLPDLVIPNPIRRVASSNGFFIAAHPVAALRASSAFTGTWTEGQALCAALSRQAGVEVALPTADEWEMAARGPDGRRYPWGNGYEPDMAVQMSPWGCLDAVGVVPQWTATRARSGAPIVCGGPNQLLCSARQSESEGRAAVRVVMRL